MRIAKTFIQHIDWKSGNTLGLNCYQGQKG